jgi:hypothetical protein
MPWIAKITFDPKAGSRSMHFEVAGLMNRFSFYNSINKRYCSITGGGVALNALLETARHLTFESPRLSLRARPRAQLKKSVVEASLTMPSRPDETIAGDSERKTHHWAK